MTKGDRLTQDRHLQEDFEDIRPRVWVISWVDEYDEPNHVFTVAVDMDQTTADYAVKVEYMACEWGVNLDDVELDQWGVGVVNFEAVPDEVDGFSVECAEIEK